MRHSRILLCVILTALGTLPGCDRGAHPTQAGKPAPDFTVSDGVTSIHLAQYRGSVVLLNFWWSQCLPCIQELPSLIQLHHDDPKLVVLAVSVDQDPSDYASFIRRRHVDLITVRDPQQIAAALFHTTMWPETYVIDRDGVIRRKFVGPTDWSDPEIRTYIKSL